MPKEDQDRDVAETPEGLSRLGSYPNEQEAHQRGLVVLSQGEPYWLQTGEEGGIELLTKEDYADWLAGQIALYERESVNWPPPEPEIPQDRAGGTAVVTWLVALIVAYLVQLRWPGLLDWGMLISDKVQAGDWYRPVSALFLHADLGHLAGNLLFGSVFLYLVARQSGNFIALVSVLAAGTGGNFLNAFLSTDTVHRSIGASTAVFGCIGILVTMQTGFVLRHYRERLSSVWILPFIAGWTMLAWFGTGSDLTDTTAHLFGFACGLPIGVLLGWLIDPLGTRTTRKAV